jgi:hypothetical protein
MADLQTVGDGFLGLFNGLSLGLLEHWPPAGRALADARERSPWITNGADFLGSGASIIGAGIFTAGAGSWATAGIRGTNIGVRVVRGGARLMTGTTGVGTAAAGRYVAYGTADPDPPRDPPPAPLPDPGGLPRHRTPLRPRGPTADP